MEYGSDGTAFTAIAEDREWHQYTANRALIGRESTCGGGEAAAIPTAVDARAALHNAS